MDCNHIASGWADGIGTGSTQAPCVESPRAPYVIARYSLTSIPANTRFRLRCHVADLGLGKAVRERVKGRCSWTGLQYLCSPWSLSGRKRAYVDESQGRSPQSLTNEQQGLTRS